MTKYPMSSVYIAKKSLGQKHSKKPNTNINTLMDTHSSIKSEILNFLNGKDFTFAGIIADHIRETTGAKASVAERKCRELAREGKLERQYAQVERDGKTLFCVQYRVKIEPESAPARVQKFAPTAPAKELSVVGLF